MKMAGEKIVGVCGRINGGSPFNCNDKAVGGIEQREIVLVNRSDIDLSKTVIDRNAEQKKHRISEFYLIADAKAFSFQGITNKKVLNATYAKESQDFADMMKHTVEVMVYNQCEESLVMLNEFLNGGEVVAIVEDKNKGENGECTYKIYGFHAGLKAGDIVYNAKENNGFVLLSLESQDDFEPYVPYVYLDTNSNTTATKIEELKSEAGSVLP